MTRMKQAGLGVCVVGVMWVSPLANGPARSAPALKDPKGHTRQSREILRKRVEALREQINGGFERVKIGKQSANDFLRTVREWYEGEVALADTREAECVVLENVLRTLVVGEEQMAQLHHAGLHTNDSVLQWQAARLKAQLELDKRRDSGR